MPEYPVEFSWARIAIAIVLPAIAGGLAALWFWRKGVGMHGAVVGTGVIFAAVLIFFLREGLEIRYTVEACNAAGRLCPVRPAPFTRFVIYGFIGLAQVAALFSVDMWLDERRKRRSVSEQWRQWGRSS